MKRLVVILALLLPTLASAQIAFINKCTGTTSCASVPAHQAGDLFIAYAGVNLSATNVTLPTGWTSSTSAPTMVASINGTSTADSAARIYCKVATSSSETVTGFTTATSLIVHIYRGGPAATTANCNTVALGTISFFTSTVNTTSVTETFNTVSNAKATSWDFGAGYAPAATAGIATAPASMTNRSSVGTVMGGHDTNAAVASYSTANVTLTTAGRIITVVAEILAPTADAPTITSASGSFTTNNNDTSFTIANGGSAVSSPGFCYSTDGVTTPNSTNGTTCSAGTLYSGAVNVTATATVVKAIAIKAGANNSSVTTQTFTLTTATPVASPVAGTYSGTQSIALTSTTTGNTIRYTTDGSAPSCPSTGTLYSGLISVAATTTIKAVACKTNYATGTASSDLFTITAPANHYVRSGAAGLGTGTDWTNACPAWVSSCAISSLTRGDTYYVAAGDGNPYGVSGTGHNFNTALAGTALITVKLATVADHGTSTGWLDAYAGQVAWAYPLLIESGYWLFDGINGDGISTTVGNYGFKVNQPTSCSTDQSDYLFIGNPSAIAVSNVTAKHFVIDSCGAAFDFAQQGLWFGCGGCGTVSSSSASLFYLHNLQNMFVMENTNGNTLEHFIVDTQWSSATHHGETFNISISNGDSTQANLNTTVRYGKFSNVGAGSGVFTANNGDTGSKVCYSGWKVYSNIIDTAINSIIKGSSTCVPANLSFYNNTIVNSSAGFYLPCDGGVGSVCASATGNVLENNLLYNGDASITLNTDSSGIAPAPTHDYQAYGTTTNTPTDTHGQILVGNPFVNLGAGNYHLTGGSDPTTAGLDLSATFTTDYYGSLFNTSAWSRGAAQWFAAAAVTLSCTDPLCNSAPFNTIAFGNQTTGNPSSAVVVTLTNSGGATLNLTSETITGTNAADFVIGSNTCSSTLGISASCTLTVTFTPGASTARTATLVYTTDAATSPNNISLTGTGSGPPSTLATLDANGHSEVAVCIGQAATLNYADSGGTSLTASIDQGIGSVGASGSTSVSPTTTTTYTLTATSSTGTASATATVNVTRCGSPF